MVNRAAIALAVLMWIACAAGAYLLFRRYWRNTFNEWRVKDRKSSLAMCILLGPTALIGELLCLIKKTKSVKGEEPAKW